MLLRFFLLLLPAAALVACSGHRSERVRGECITEIDCGDKERCEAETCVALGDVLAIGKVIGAPSDVEITLASASAGPDACRQRGADGLLCTIEPGGNVVLVAPDVPGHRFVGWAGPPACTSTSSTLTLARLVATTECEARYARRLRVSGVVEGDPLSLVLASADGPTARCGGNTCEIDALTPAVLQAPTRPGLALIGFDGPGCEARSGYRVTVTPRDADVLCTARYGESLVVRGEARGAEAAILATSPSEGARCTGARCEIGLGDAAALRAPELPGFRFRGWSGHPACSSVAQVAQIPDVRESLLCTGDYVPRFSVSGVSEGAAAEVSATSADAFAQCAGATCEVDRESAVTLMASSVPGARLRGWRGDGCVAGAGASASVGDVTRNVQCIAQYEPGVSVSGTVIDATGEVVASSPAPRAACARGACVIGLGEQVTLVAPALDQRTFMGWSGDPGCTGSDRTLTLRDVTSSKVCRASFVPRFRIAGRPQPAAGGTVAASSSVPSARCEGARCDADQGGAVVLTATAGASHRFTGWSGGEGCMSSQPRLELRDVRANLTCDAAFAARVLVSGDPMPADGGRVLVTSTSSAAACTGNRCTVDSGANVLLVATPSPGYRFSGWSGCAEAPPSMAMSSMLTLASAAGTRCVAGFVRVPVTVSASVIGGGGSVSVASSQPNATCAGTRCTFLSGGLAVISARPDAGHQVARWSCAAGSPASVTLTNVIAPQHCEVSFARIAHSVRATTAGGGGIEAIYAGAVCLNGVCSVRHGDGLTLRVTTRDEEWFTGFTGCATSTPTAVGPGVFTATVSGISGPQTCVANVINRAAVAYTAAPAGCSTVRATVTPAHPGSACTGSRCLVLPGSAVSLEPLVNPGCRFLRWDCRGSQGPTFVGSIAQLANLGATSDVSCTAVLEVPAI